VTTNGVPDAQAVPATVGHAAPAALLVGWKTLYFKKLAPEAKRRVPPEKFEPLLMSILGTAPVVQES
jgi:hypothetical protein